MFVSKTRDVRIPHVHSGRNKGCDLKWLAALAKASIAQNSPAYRHRSS